jgi:hypothetical protein
MLDKEGKFFQSIVKSDNVLKFLKNSKHTPYVIELDGESPVLIDLLNTLIPLAKKIKNPNSEVKQKLCDLISLLIASQMGVADKMVQELVVRNETKNLDMNYLTLVNDETRPKE